MDLSVIIPAFNEQEGIQNSIGVISDTFAKNNIDFELIFVDDGSKDNTFSILKDNAEKSNNISVIKFSRNYGKEAAIYAGMKYAKGNAVVIMDSDLQHPPEVAVEMYKIWKNNSNIKIVEAHKKSRGKENIFHKFFANLFYKILKGVSGLDLKNASDFKLMDKKVVEEILNIPERQTFSEQFHPGSDLTSTLFILKYRNVYSAKQNGRLSH